MRFKENDQHQDDYQKAVFALKTYESLLDNLGPSSTIKKYLILQHKPKQSIDNFEELDRLRNFSSLLETHEQSHPLVKKTIIQTIGKLNHIFPSLRSNYYVGVQQLQDKRSKTLPEEKLSQTAKDQIQQIISKNINAKKKSIPQKINEFLKKKKLLSKVPDELNYDSLQEDVTDFQEISIKRNNLSKAFGRLHPITRKQTGVSLLDQIEKSFEENRQLTAECLKLEEQMKPKSIENKNFRLKSELYDMTHKSLKVQILFKNKRKSRVPLDIRMNRVFPLHELDFLKRKRNEN